MKFQAAFTKQELADVHQKVLKPCIEKTGPSDFDIKEANEHKLPSTKTGKCLRTCVLEMAGIVRKKILR